MWKGVKTRMTQPLVAARFQLAPRLKVIMICYWIQLIAFNNRLVVLFMELNDSRCVG